ncbi:MAG: methylmalonyl-CoA epimerase [Candidatus Thermoplasmatota archaeon]|nr:methylmalonyl-CoA epimerase [Candidatus Thermoplasmatota archaeon]
MDLGKIYIDHIGIATNSLDEGSKFWKLIGLSNNLPDELVADQGVTTRFFETSKDNSDTQSPPMIELLEPTSNDTPIGKFIEKRGIGIQQLCLRVENIEKVINHLIDNGIRMIDSEPRLGSHGALIAFVHPKSTGGVLVELAQKN